ncbi:tetratricopeptide repeat protein [Dongia deserti]|uniref:tetratricopeptide repeat protein n=1 Tax=Dongia deserti TaxID=2268030 RepID=UPI000E655E46|nr:tetratricopeptide repeat protein [Dongia deserti]
MDSAGNAETGLDTALVLEQLQRIIDSKDFDASERNRRFLRYVVEEMLAGRGERIKAYNIATSVFGRDESFDPQSDPIVRIEASRLRRSLDRYYLTAGRDDVIRITIPKGSYAPSVEGSVEEVPRDSATPTHEVPGGQAPANEVSRKPSMTIAAAAGLAVLAVMVSGVLWATGYIPQPADSVQAESSRRGPAILVAPFENDGGSHQQSEFARGFTREVITGLTRFNDLFVFGPETSFLYNGGTDISKIATELGVDFILTGGVTTTPTNFRITTSLLDANNGQYVWSDRFVGDLAAVDVHAVRDKIADQVIQKLAQPYGVIFNKKAREIEGKPAESMTSYECVLRFYQYWRSYRVELHEPVRECLERTVTTDQSYADAYASLAIVYVDAYRFNFGRESLSFDPMVRAHELAQRAIELAPDSSFSYHALHLVYWLMNEVDLSLAAGERGLQLNPNNSSLMADLGLRYGDRTQWDKGLPLLEEAYARNPGQPGQYRIAFVLKHYVEGDYEEALAQAKQLDAPNVAIAYVALAMCYGQLGRAEEAKAAVAQILAIDPTYGARALDDLRMRNVHEDYIPLILDGLAKAGMVIPGYPRDAS